jgi:hypothetical protein
MAKNYCEFDARARARVIEKMRLREAVKRQLAAEGKKVSHYSAKEISLMVEAAQAVQNLQLTHRAPRPEPQAQVLCETHAQNGTAR